MFVSHLVLYFTRGQVRDIIASLMDQEIQKRVIIQPHLIIGVIVLLFAMVAIFVNVVDAEPEAELELEIVDDVVSESEFSGIDGSLTLFAFDMVAREWSSYMNELVDESVSFDVWLKESSDRIPQTDAFNNKINIREFENEFVLWSMAKDGLELTDDDYIKTYKYEQTPGNL